MKGKLFIIIICLMGLVVSPDPGMACGLSGGNAPLLMGSHCCQQMVNNNERGHAAAGQSYRPQFSTPCTPPSGHCRHHCYCPVTLAVPLCLTAKLTVGAPVNTNRNEWAEWDPLYFPMGVACIWRPPKIS